MVGKDILRFHAVYWPAFLMSAGIEAPKGVFAHGWWTVEGQKMSKSLGNVVDPYEMVETYGADAFRYFLLREVPFGQDGDFSRKALVHRINSDLANDFGNLLNRTLGMLGKYFGGTVPRSSPSGAEDQALISLSREVAGAVDRAMEAVEFHKALSSVWDLVKAANRYVDVSAPWALAKDPAKRDRLGAVLYNLWSRADLRAARLPLRQPRPRCGRHWDLKARSRQPVDRRHWGSLRSASPYRVAVAFPESKTEWRP
jgi:methionyl-tRNA synthetase